MRPFTIVRSRFLIGIETDQVIGSERQIGAVGGAVVSDQAVAVGVTAVPMPITDMASDLWFFHQLAYNTFRFASGVGFDASASEMYEVDSKAMRKVDIGQDIVIVGELSATGEGFNLLFGGRMLVKVN